MEVVKKKYQIGDTVLLSKGQGCLDPVEVVSIEDHKNTVCVRRFYRRSQFATKNEVVPRNELLHSSVLESVRPERIERCCYIKSCFGNDPVPVPYNRGGTGDCFFVRSHVTSDGTITPLLMTKSTHRDGIDFGTVCRNSIPPLRGMDLFCGGGSFGRGIEEGGAVQMKWAVDLDRAAINTYRANLKDTKDTALYFGSVNNYLEDAIREKYSALIASPVYFLP